MPGHFWARSSRPSLSEINRDAGCPPGVTSDGDEKTCRLGPLPNRSPGVALYLNRRLRVPMIVGPQVQCDIIVDERRRGAWREFRTGMDKLRWLMVQAAGKGLLLLLRLGLSPRRASEVVRSHEV